MTARRYQSQSEEETVAIARQFAATLRPGSLVLLYGDLGAGKTFFVRAVVSYFDRDVAATSPTFSLVNVYPTQPPILHFDLYRIQSDEDLIDLGFEESIESDNIVLVEWGEKCERFLPAQFRRVTFSVTGEQSREIVIEEVEHVGSGG